MSLELLVGKICEEFDTCPIEESGVRVSWPDYEKAVKIEAQCYIKQLKAEFPDYLLIYRSVWQPHDYGRHLQVRAYCVDDSDKAIEQLTFVETHLPEYWTPESFDLLDAKFKESFGCTYCYFVAQRGDVEKWLQYATQNNRSSNA